MSLSTLEGADVGLPARRLVALTAGISEPSSTRMLADRLAQRSVQQLRELGSVAEVGTVELAPLALDIARATVANLRSEDLNAAFEEVATADGIIACTPVYKAGISGLFKSFVDLLDNDLLIAKPVLLAATAGTARHSLVIDEQIRPLFAYMRALVLPTSVFAASEDWASPELNERISRSSSELATVVHAGLEHAIVERGWSSYQHEFGSNATRAEKDSTEMDFDSPLMRLATGGTAG